MTVAIFTDHDVHSRRAGGSAAVVQALRHAPPDIRLRIYGTAPASAEHPDSIGLSRLTTFARLSTYASDIGRPGYAIVQVHSAGPSGLTGLYVSWRLGVPLIASTDGRIGARLSRWLYKRCSAVLAPSNHARDLLTEAGIDSSRIEVCRHGVDTTVFSPARRSEQVRERWHVSNNRPAIVHVAAELHDDDARVLGTLRDHLYRRRIEHALIIVAEAPIQPSIRDRLGDAILTGPLSDEALAAVMASADVAVFPVAGATIGAMVLEAQASGLPVVVGHPGDGGEYVVDGRTGAVCRTRDPEEWAQALHGLLREPGMRRVMGSAAREYALRHALPEALDAVFGAYRTAFQRCSGASAGARGHSVRT